MDQPKSAAAAHHGVIRQLRPSEWPRFRDHLLRLDPRSRHDRFNGAIDDAFVETYADRCFAEGTAVIGYLEGERVVGAAELHEKAGEDEPTAEIAFSVERAFQHRGIGAALFERLLEAAKGMGYARLRVTTHPDNAAMRALAQKFGVPLRFDHGDTVGLISLPPVPAARIRRGGTMQRGAAR